MIANYMSFLNQLLKLAIHAMFWYHDFQVKQKTKNKQLKSECALYLVNHGILFIQCLMLPVEIK